MDGLEEAASHFCQHMMMKSRTDLTGSMKDGAVWSQTDENAFPMNNVTETDPHFYPGVAHCYY